MSNCPDYLPSCVKLILINKFDLDGSLIFWDALNTQTTTPILYGVTHMKASGLPFAKNQKIINILCFAVFLSIAQRFFFIQSAVLLISTLEGKLSKITKFSYGWQF